MADDLKANVGPQRSYKSIVWSQLLRINLNSFVFSFHRLGAWEDLGWHKEIKSFRSLKADEKKKRKI